MANRAYSTADDYSSPRTASRAQNDKWRNLYPRIEAVENAVLTPSKPGDWIAPQLSNGWTNYFNTDSKFPPAGFLKDALGFVRLRGYMVAGTLSAVIFTLPEGYRPLFRMTFLGYAYNGAAVVGNIEVRQDGSVFVTAPALTTNLVLDAVCFLAEQ